MYDHLWIKFDCEQKINWRTMEIKKINWRTREIKKNTKYGKFLPTNEWRNFCFVLHIFGYTQTTFFSSHWRANNAVWGILLLWSQCCNAFPILSWNVSLYLSLYLHTHRHTHIHIEVCMYVWIKELKLYYIKEARGSVMYKYRYSQTSKYD